MKRYAIGYCLALLVCLAMMGSAYGYQSVQLSDEPTAVRMLDHDQSGMTLELSIGEVYFLDVATKEGSFSMMTVQGMTPAANYGEPAVPVSSELIQIPLGCTLRGQVLASDAEEIDLKSLGINNLIMPTQPSISKSDDPSAVPFQWDQETYAQSGFYRLAPVEFEYQGIMRGVRHARVQVAPVEYNPANNTVRVYKKMTVQISYENADWAATEELYTSTYSPVFESAYRKAINYEQAMGSAKDNLMTYPIHYVIVGDPDFEDELEPFVQWKTEVGYVVHEFYTDEIGSSTSAITSFLETFYDTSTVKPSYLLIAADDNQISAHSGTAGSHITDLYFCEYTGDTKPEIYYGRFSAQDEDDLLPQINKTLEYEKFLMPDPSYLAEVTLVSGVDGGYADPYGNGQINYGTNHYFNAAHGITPHVWLYPASDGSGAAADIIETIDDGVSFYNYTAHCGHSGHSDPSFTTSHLPGLTNYHQYLLGIGNCCLPNTFGASYGSDCFGEAFLKLDTTGGIGYIGSTNSTYWDEDYWWGVGYGSILSNGPDYEDCTMGAYDGMFHDHGEAMTDWYSTNGAIVTAGALGVDASTSSRKTYYWECYHLMGDPSLLTYCGIPTVNAVVHDDAVIMTTTNMTVEADPGSYVGITFNGALQGAGFVDESGSVDIPLVGFAEPGDAQIVVTCQFREPYIETFSVITPEGPYVLYEYYDIDDAAGNGNGMVDFGEDIALSVGLINVGPDDALDVVAKVTTTDEYVTMTDSTEEYGTIIGDNGTGYVLDGFAFTAAGNIPDGHRIDFDVEVSGTARETWTGGFSITAHAPALEIVTISIDDAAYGDNNGILDPGETADFVIDLLNSGSGQVYGVAAVASEDDEYVAVDDADGYFGMIDASGGTADNSGDVFTLSADSTCPLGYAVPVTLTLTGDGGFAGTLVFNLTVGDRVVFFYDDFSFDQGWTGLGGDAEWEMGPAVAGGGDPGEDVTESGDNMILGNDIGSTYNSYIDSTMWVYSPVIDAANMSGVEMRYWHLFGMESSTYDHGYLQVYDGTDWVTLFENGSTNQETEWTSEFYDLSAVADSNADFQIRFGLGSTDGSGTYSGWNIDDIEVKGYGRVGQPSMMMDAAAVSDSVQPGESTEETFQIKNEGDGTLRVWFSSEDTWLDFSSDMQTLYPGDSMDFVVTLSSAGMVCGDHMGSLDYATNDNSQSEGSIPFHLHIYSPDIALSSYELTEDLEADQQSTVPLTISNNGPGRLDYTLASQMFKGAAVVQGAGEAQAEPIEWVPADADKSDRTEPVYPANTKGYGGPDTYGHTWIDSDEGGGPGVEWIDISSVGTEVTLGDDEGSAAIPIGFGFPFYDSVYTELYINSNGVVTFDFSTGYRANFAMPHDSVGAAIAMFWDDLDPRQNGAIRYYHDATNGRFIVSFDNIPFYYSSTGTGDLSFQAVMYENGYIQLNYGTMEPGSRTLTSATAGIGNAEVTDGLTVMYNAVYMHTDLSILITAQHWLSVLPAGGSIDPYSQTIVNVNFDATDMEDGVYTGQIAVVTNDPDTPSQYLPVTLNVGQEQTWICADVDGNGIVADIEDLVYLAAYMFQEGPEPPELDACDVDGNGTPADIADLIYLVDYMFNEGPAPDCP